MIKEEKMTGGEHRTGCDNGGGGVGRGAADQRILLSQQQSAESKKSHSVPYVNTAARAYNNS